MFLSLLLFDMKSFDVIERFSEAGLLFRDPVMSGHYVWRQKGMVLVERLCGQFENVCETQQRIRHVTPDTFMDGISYQTFYEHVADYANVYCSLNGEVVVRPENTRALLASLSLEGPEIIALTNTPLYRQFQTKPFLVDQRIWPALGMAQRVSPPELEKTRDHLWNNVQCFFASCLLPVLWVRQEKGFKGFADDMLLPLTSEDTDALTVVSTLFTLSTQMTASTFPEQRVLQYGFSERLLYCYARMQEDRPVVVWPSEVTPIQLSVSSSLSRWADQYPEFAEFRVGENQEDAPIVLWDEGGKIQYSVRVTGEQGTLESPGQVRELLRKSDAWIEHNNKQYFDRTLSANKVQSFCADCTDRLEGYTSVGEVFPRQQAVCEHCETPHAFLQVFVPTTTHRTINEKLTKKTV